MVERLAGHGARVAIWGLDLTLAEAVAGRIGNCAIAAYERTGKAFGHVDILVNSAGIAGSNGPVADYSVEEFQTIIAINLTGTFHVNKAVWPGMRAQNHGRIVNTASVAGKEGNPDAGAYSASKAGVIGLTKSPGKEQADRDIAVNCVTPAAARTRIFDQMKQEHFDFMLSKVPRGRFLELSEAAAMTTWLVTEENGFATGGVFDLSGGRATY